MTKLPAMAPHSDPEYLARRIAEVGHWHHRIAITPEVMTPGAQDTQALLAQVGMPEDCTGMRVLDIGARDGFFTFEAERRGAAEVVAVDNVPPEKTGFAVASELLGSEARYVTDNVYNLSVERYGKFDLVLFFGVLYHLRHPLLALDHIWDVCNRGAQLYVESHMIDEGLVDHDGSFHRLDSLNADLLGLPLVQFYPGAMLGNDFTSTWAPNQVALRGMLESAGFDVVHQWLVAFRGGAIAVARDLDPEGQRAADAASAWDLTHNEILAPSEYSPPVST
jgi:tRNA (mo5U34)-methyltransferase